MSQPKQYMAGSVPRFIRQTKLGYLPLNCLVGSRIIRGDAGVNLIMDIIMMPVPEFQRMKANVGLQHVMAPGLKADASFNPAFIIADAKHVTVPAEEPDPEGFARHYFMMEFGLIMPAIPTVETPNTDLQMAERPKEEAPSKNLPETKPPEKKGSLFSRSARDYTILKE